MMTGAVRYRLAPDPISNRTIDDSKSIEDFLFNQSGEDLDLGYEITPIMVTTTLAFGVGIVMVCL